MSGRTMRYLTIEQRESLRAQLKTLIEQLREEIPAPLARLNSIWG